VRRTKFDLDEAEKTRGIFLKVTSLRFDNIDAVIALIKKSKDVESAKQGLMKKFKLSEDSSKSNSRHASTAVNRS